MVPSWVEFVPLALTEIICCVFPLGSTIRPIVENTVEATQVTAEEPDAVIINVGATVGVAIPRFQVALAKPVSAAGETFPETRVN